VLSNRKPAQRRGKVALIDARDCFSKMRKSLGDKRKFLTEEHIAEVTRLYHDALELNGKEKRVKVFDRGDFGFQRVTVERPLRRVWQLREEALDGLTHAKAWAAWTTPPKGHGDPAGYVHDVEQAQATLARILRRLADAQSEATEKAFVGLLRRCVDDAAISVPEKVMKVIVAAAAVVDANAPFITDRSGKPLADAEFRDTENMPLPYGWFDLGEAARAESLEATAEAHLSAEIHPYALDAWIDHGKTKVGVEIPFTRHFHEYVPSRPLEEIDAELFATEERILELLKGLAR
jgi:type I restriction enzyme M protein